MSDPLDIIFTRRNGAGTGHEQINVPEVVNGTFGLDNDGNLVARTAAEQLVALNVLRFRTAGSYSAGNDQVLVAFGSALTGQYLVQGVVYGTPTTNYSLNIIDVAAVGTYQSGTISTGELADLFTGTALTVAESVTFSGILALTDAENILLTVPATQSVANLVIALTLIKLP